MVHSISILGSTGSIGRQTVAVAEHLGLNVRALTTNRNIQLAEEQARRLHPAFVAVTDEASAKALRIALADTDIAVGGGENALCEAAVISDTDAVVTAVSGAVGLRPTLAAIEKGRRIALANKETLVCAGDIVMRRARECGAEIVPVDSEHSAIFQCLTGRAGELHKILLTGSGGPFRGWTREATRDVTPEMAVSHPNWSMGAKISVDSATMMNKGLEFIEAMHLFGVTPDDIQVLIHPESVVHSMVELLDGREEGIEVDEQDRRALPRLQERFGKSVRHREPTCAGSIARACRDREGSSLAPPAPRESTGRQAPRHRPPT